MQAQTTRPLAGTSWLSGSPQTQGFAWRICGANHLHETRGVLQVYNLEGQVLQLSTVEACLRYFQHFMICPIELRTNLQVIMSSHVIPCYPMSLVLVSRFNWFNVILCGLFFPRPFVASQEFQSREFPRRITWLEACDLHHLGTASILPDEFLNVADLCPWKNTWKTWSNLAISNWYKDVVAPCGTLQIIDVHHHHTAFSC